MKENKLTKRMNPIFGDNIAKWEIHKQLFGVRSFLTGNTTSVSRWNKTLKNVWKFYKILRSTYTLCEYSQ